MNRGPKPDHTRPPGMQLKSTTTVRQALRIPVQCFCVRPSSGRGVRVSGELWDKTKFVNA